jgi:hypothetical protein
VAADGSISVTPMYSPVAVDGSISLVIRSTPRSGDQITFISSSASDFSVSSARIT